MCALQVNKVLTVVGISPPTSIDNVWGTLRPRFDTYGRALPGHWEPCPSVRQRGKSYARHFSLQVMRRKLIPRHKENVTQLIEKGSLPRNLRAIGGAVMED
jgi:hypothetical protein